MGLRAKRIWVWAVAAALLAQLTLALGHSHGPEALSSSHFADAHQLAVRGATGHTSEHPDTAVAADTTADDLHEQALAHGDTGQSETGQSETGHADTGHADTGHGAPEHGHGCDLCWGIAVFAALIIPLALGVIPLGRRPTRYAVRLTTTGAHAVLFDPYRARAPPFAFHT